MGTVQTCVRGADVCVVQTCAQCRRVRGAHNGIEKCIIYIYIFDTSNIYIYVAHLCCMGGYGSWLACGGCGLSEVILMDIWGVAVYKYNRINHALQGPHRSM